jgi:DNA-binding protein YbaB
MTDTNDMLANLEARAAEMQRMSEQLTNSFKAAGATAASPDGAVRVKVGPTGAFEEVQLGPSASRYAPAELAGIINRTAAQAQRIAAQQVRSAFAPFAQGESMALVDSFLPPPPEAVDDAPSDGLATEDEVTEPTPPASRPAPPPSKKDDDDFDQPW